MLKTRKVLDWPAFARGDSPWVVVLNPSSFPSPGMLHHYASAYHNAARLLFDSAMECDGPNRLNVNAFLPVVFLYRHALELYLKNVILRGNDLLHQHGKVAQPWNRLFNCHKLDGLLQTVQEVFSLIDYSGAWKTKIFQSFADVQRVVLEMDKQSHDAFRYPVDTSGKDLPPHSLRFEPRVLAETLDALFVILDTAAWRAWEARWPDADFRIPRER